MSWVRTAKVGDKVTRISRHDWDDLRGESVPVYGVVYTIRHVIPEPEGVFLRFEEVMNAPRQYPDGFEECAFDATEFRPVEPRKTDISFAYEILRNATKPAEERV